MLFNSYEFIFVFLPILFVLICLTRNQHHRLISVIIFASSVFYAWWDIRYLCLMYFSIIVNFYLGKALFVRKLKPVLVLAIGFNLTLLVIFKYLMLLLSSANEFLNSGFHVPHIILPLAISFYTFQQIAFIVDTYRGNLIEYPSLKMYCLFVMFFPQLIAGPIVYSKQVFHQYKRFTENISWENIYIGILIFIIGLFKKLVIADSFAGHADSIFSIQDINQLTSLDAWAGTVCFGLQIYFDFSAYSDMAIGLGRMMGIELPVNFMSPYKSKSIIEFWRRWHITLSGFLREYVYIPLGGNRGGHWQQSLNILITMLLGGIWHGASWAFMFWGGMHGLMIVVNHLWRRLITNRFAILKTSTLYTIFCFGITLLLVFMAWVPFRINNPDEVLIVWHKMFSLSEITSLPILYEQKFGSISNFLVALGFEFNSVELFPVFKMLTDCLLGLIVCLLLPNTAELFRQYLSCQKHLDASLYYFNFKQINYQHNGILLLSTLIFIVSTLYLSRVVQFIYFQF